MIHLEPAEVLAVLRTARAKGSREWAMILVAYKHGMRVSEVCNLRLGDIDLKNGSIVVERLKGSLRTTQAVTEHRGTYSSALASKRLCVETLDLCQCFLDLVG